MMPNMLRRRALRIDQVPDHPLYLFALRASEIFQIADVSRISRDEAGSLLGYQRDQVRKHVEGILEYLNSAGGEVPFPHAIILALPSSTSFVKVRGPRTSDEAIAEAGTLQIPLHGPGEPKPAWIVDGQQRALALSRCNNPNYPVPVCALVADDIATQRDQFLRINTTKPLSKSLISELLPAVDTVLPSHLAAKKAPSALCDMLNQDPQSPFYGLIKRASRQARPDLDKAVVTDTALMRMLETSLAEGCLFSYRDLATGETDFKRIQKLIYIFWTAVKAIWPEAWGLPPTRSRLMHSAGLLAMGKLMDLVMWNVDVDDPVAVTKVMGSLEKMKPYCQWTSGKWEELDSLEWNKIQNLPNHVKMLSNYLIRSFRDCMRETR